MGSLSNIWYVLAETPLTSPVLGPLNIKTRTRFVNEIRERGSRLQPTQLTIRGKKKRGQETRATLPVSPPAGDPGPLAIERETRTRKRDPTSEDQ